MIQLNDPDPYHWFAIYLLVAIIHIVVLFKPLSKKLLWVVIVGLLAYSFYHFAYFMDWLQIDEKAEIFGEMVYEKPYLEGTRPNSFNFFKFLGSEIVRYDSYLFGDSLISTASNNK